MPQLSDTDLGISDPDLQSLARLGLLTPEQAALAIGPQFAAAGAGDWNPGTGLAAGGALLRPSRSDAAPASDDLAALRALAPGSDGGQAAPAPALVAGGALERPSAPATVGGDGAAAARPAAGYYPAIGTPAYDAYAREEIATGSAPSGPGPQPAAGGSTNAAGASGAPAGSTAPAPSSAPSQSPAAAAPAPAAVDVSKMSDDELVARYASGTLSGPAAAPATPAASGGAAPAPSPSAAPATTATSATGSATTSAANAPPADAIGAHILAEYQRQAQFWSLMGPEYATRAQQFQHYYDEGVKNGFVTDPNGVPHGVPGILAAQAAATANTSGAQMAGEDPHTLEPVTITDSAGHTYQTKKSRQWILDNMGGFRPPGVPEGAPGNAPAAGTAPAAAAAPTPGSAPPAAGNLPAAANAPPPQAGAPPAPPAAGSGFALSGTPQYTPTQTGVQQALEKQANEIQTNETAAQNTLVKVADLKAAADTFKKGVLGGTGPTADQRADLLNKYIDLMNQLGIKVPDNLRQTLTAEQVIGKVGGQLTVQQTAGLGSGQAATVYNQIGNFMPNILQSQGGFDAIVNSIDQQARLDTDRAKYMRAWLANPANGGTIEGMTEAFARDRPPELYSSRVMPVPVPPGGSAAMRPDVVYGSADGSRWMRNPNPSDPKKPLWKYGPDEAIPDPPPVPTRPGR